MRPKANTIAIFHSFSQYGVANRFLYEMGQEWSRLGYRPVVIDFEKSSDLPEGEVAFAISTNGASLDVKLQGSHLHTLLGVPLIAFIIDDPVSVASRLPIDTHGVVRTATDRQLAPHVGAHYLPHGGCLPPERERDIELSFFATYHNPDLFYQPDYENVAVDSSRPLRLTFGDHNFEQCERYHRYKKRYDLLCTLTRLGLKCDLFGYGWETHPDIDHHTHHGPLSFARALECMGRSKRVIHLAPPFTADGHERPLSAMAAGAQVFLEDNPFFQTHFIGGEDYFPLEALEELPPFAPNPARAKVVAGHTWAHRARQLLELV